jgi:hypothetical protein
MTEPRLLLRFFPLTALVAVLIFSSAPAALAGAVSDYCRLFTKEDIETTLNIRITEVKPWPLKVVLGPENLHDQACVFFAGSRTLRITVTETPSISDAEHTFTNTVSGQSIMNSAKPLPLTDVHDEAIMTASTVVMRRQNLVINFSMADFGSDDDTRMTLARALAQKVSEKLLVATSSS